MTDPTPSPIKNRILAALPKSDYQNLSVHLEPVELKHGQVLYEIGETIEHLYFPSNAMISLVTEMEDGKIVEVGLIGNDGASGASVLMGRPNSFERALIQIPNGGVRIKASVVKKEFDKGGELQRLLLGYVTDLMRQVSQTAACNASHTTEERLARWLLMCRDRVESLHFKLTQEFLAEMLGTRRATVSVAAITLQSANLIEYSRGHITIIEEGGLEAFSCECYKMLRQATADGNH
ncbi:MAG TPA: Crp/Fnr family transcriptional regulator [Pyrinomonadaceae bacterium]